MAGTDVFTHVKYMLKSTITAYVIALIFFGIYGFKFSSNGNMDTSQITSLMDGLKSTFNINPILLLPPIVVILAIALKIPALPGIALGAIVGAVLAPIFQSNMQIFYNGDNGPVFQHAGANFGDILYAAKNGFIAKSGVTALDSLLTTGGLMNMASSILMTIIAMMFGGIMEFTHQLEVIVGKLTKIIKSGPALIIATELTCVASNITMPEQYISILIPGRMYAEAYRKAGIHPMSLSNALESAGTVTSPLIPWNTCAMFIASTLKIETYQYFKWAVFNYTMPIVTIIFAFLGITVTKMTSEQRSKADEGELV